MRCIDTERQLADIFIKPLDSSRFTDFRGGDWCLPSIWLSLKESCALSCILYIFLFHCIFFTHQSHLVILTCICLIMLINVLELVVMRCYHQGSRPLATHAPRSRSMPPSDSWHSTMSERPGPLRHAHRLTGGKPLGVLPCVALVPGWRKRTVPCQWTIWSRVSCVVRLERWKMMHG
jgi:hypothetical protein